MKRFQNASRNFVDSLNGRLVETSAVYIAFILFLNSTGPDQTFSLVLPVSTALAVFYLYRDNNLKRSISRGYFSLISIALLAVLLLIVYPPKLNEWYTVFLLQGFREELFFRFFILGLFGKWLFPEQELGLSLRSVLLLVLNGILFCLVHAQYTELTSLTVVFILGIAFGFFFVKMGLITSIVFHGTWNVYLPIRWPAIIFCVGLFTAYWLQMRQRGSLGDDLQRYQRL